MSQKGRRGVVGEAANTYLYKYKLLANLAVAELCLYLESRAANAVLMTRDLSGTPRNDSTLWSLAHKSFSRLQVT